MSSALWKRIDTPGHDAAVLSHDHDALRLEGVAAFAGDAGPVSVLYQVEVRAGRTLAQIEGRSGESRFHHSIERQGHGWLLDGRDMGLGHLDHLDLGFTPATNILLLTAAGPRVGESVDIPVLWFDIGEKRLSEMPQHYIRRDRHRYGYVAPGYTATLQIADDGFIGDYPGLWRREA